MKMIYKYNTVQYDWPIMCLYIFNKGPNLIEILGSIVSPTTEA